VREGGRGRGRKNRRRIEQKKERGGGGGGVIRKKKKMSGGHAMAYKQNTQKPNENKTFLKKKNKRTGGERRCGC
jgi:hypothetical protein